MTNTNYNIVICTDKKGGISKNGIIPWKYEEDSNYFRDIITRKYNNNKNVIVMGRKTYEQMGLVKNHINIIISNTIIEINGAYIFNNINNCINWISENKYTNIYICGGKNIYDYFLKLDNIKLYWTYIDYDYECDNFIDIKLLEDICINNIKNEYICSDKKNNINNVLTFYKTNNIINHEENNYLTIMKNIITNGSLTSGRNGYTYSLFGEILKFKLSSYPLLTTKKVFFKGVFEELMFFIRGQTNSKILSDKGVKIWEKNTTPEFLNSCNLDYEQYDMGPMYGFQWRHFNAEYNGINYNYDNKGFDQLKYILSELKNNPSSRRILMTTYNPQFANKGVLFPCHGISIQFNTTKINDTYYLNISQNQRSCDYFLGVPFNIASYALLNYMICHILNNDDDCKYKFCPGELTMFLGDYHLYESHLLQAKRQTLRSPYIFPKLQFNKNIKNIEDFELEDVELLFYDSYPNIQAEMVP